MRESQAIGSPILIHYERWDASALLLELLQGISQGAGKTRITTTGGSPTMLEAAMTIRERLKAKRNRLLKKFLKNPVNTRLAIKIRLIDDLVAEITEHLVQQTKSRRDHSKLS